MARSTQYLVGDYIRAGEITRDDVVRLVETMFNGERTLPVGSKGHHVILKKFDGLTRHLQECLTTIILTSHGVAPEGSAAAITDSSDVADAAHETA